MASLPFTATVMSQLPCFTPVTVPESSTVAMLSSLLFHTRSPASACPVVDIFTAMEPVLPSSTARNCLSVFNSRMLALVASLFSLLASVFSEEEPSAEATTWFCGMMLDCFLSEKNSSRTANPRMINMTYNRMSMIPVLENLSQNPSFDRFAILRSFLRRTALFRFRSRFFSKM